MRGAGRGACARSSRASSGSASLEFTATEPYLVARVEPAPDRTCAGAESEALRRAVLDLLPAPGRRSSPELPDEMAAAAETLADPRQVAYLVASTVAPERRGVARSCSSSTRSTRSCDGWSSCSSTSSPCASWARQITAETQERLTKAQRDILLREQLRSIQQELGEGGEDAELDDLRRRIDEAGLPDEARREAERELERLAAIPPASPEHGIIRTYLEWMAEPALDDA